MLGHTHPQQRMQQQQQHQRLVTQMQLWWTPWMLQRIHQQQQQLKGQVRQAQTHLLLLQQLQQAPRVVVLQQLKWCQQRRWCQL
jgi:hypothetical protein